MVRTRAAPRRTPRRTPGQVTAAEAVSLQRPTGDVGVKNIKYKTQKQRH